MFPEDRRTIRRSDISHCIHSPPLRYFIQTAELIHNFLYDFKKFVNAGRDISMSKVGPTRQTSSNTRSFQAVPICAFHLNSASTLDWLSSFGPDIDITLVLVLRFLYNFRELRIFVLNCAHAQVTQEMTLQCLKISDYFLVHCLILQ